MALTDWWARLRERPARRPKRASYRLRLEPLEERLADKLLVIGRREERRLQVPLLFKLPRVKITPVTPISDRTAGKSAHAPEVVHVVGKGGVGREGGIGCVNLIECCIKGLVCRVLQAIELSAPHRRPAEHRQRAPISPRRVR